jgi:enamine deaminase RidA (YjgF/YER057c/UK114 family)
MSPVARSNPPELGRPLGPYSHVARANGGELLFIAGQLHDGPGLASQCDGVFRAIGIALRSAGADWRHVAQFTTYLVSADLIPAFMEWRHRNFPGMFGDDGYPPNTLLVVSRLVDPQFLVEVQTIAVA